MNHKLSKETKKKCTYIFLSFSHPLITIFLILMHPSLWTVIISTLRDQNRIHVKQGMMRYALHEGWCHCSNVCLTHIKGMITFELSEAWNQKAKPPKKTIWVRKSGHKSESISSIYKMRSTLMQEGYVFTSYIYQAFSNYGHQFESAKIF